MATDEPAESATTNIDDDDDEKDGESTKSDLQNRRPTLNNNEWVSE